MVRVKICGITNIRDAVNAVNCGADALGFVFAKSPRKISLRQAKMISKAVGPWVGTVGVFVNEKIENILRAVAECQLSAVQLHGDESAVYAKRLAAFKVIKAFRVGNVLDLAGTQNYPADTYLFDAKVDGKFGGTGKSFAWEILKSRRISRPFIVSGGLNPANVKNVVRILAPYGVEASSGVESAPGRKNPRLVREFIRNAKAI